MPQLTCENLTVGYDGKKVRENVSFAVERGDYLCIVGENGSGKTTLMKTLLGLQSPISGKILMGEGLKPTEIGYLPQQTEVQKDFPASVCEIVCSGCQSRCGLRPFYTRAEKQMAQEAMCKMRIDDLAGRSSASCWHARCAPRKRCCCSTSRYPVWIRQRPPRCTA